MKRTTTQPVTEILCDICAAETSRATTCLICRRDFCHACEIDHIVRYKSKLHFISGSDGFYCVECDSKLKSGAISSPLFNAYHRMKLLVSDYSRQTTSLRVLQEIIEKDIESLRKDQ